MGEPVLFNLSVRDNILLGLKKEEREKITKENLIRVGKLAHLFDFMLDDVEEADSGSSSTTPEDKRFSWHVPVGVRGCKLSGGQKQRIAIARALIRKARILLLDEATSALDNRSEREVQAALDGIGDEKITQIIVAHKLCTVRNCDLILVLGGGKLVEQGTHEDLMKLGGLYHKLTLMGEGLGSGI